MEGSLYELIERYIFIGLYLLSTLLFLAILYCLKTLRNALCPSSKFLFDKEHVKCLSCGLTVFCMESNTNLCSKMTEERSCNIIEGLRYCCPLKCIGADLTWDEVDGLACRICESFGSCRCACILYQYMRNKK